MHDLTLPTEVDLALFVLRVVIGVTIAAHGYNKFFGGGRIAGTARWFDGIGMRPGRLHAYMAATTEVGSGVLLVLGLLTSLAAAALIGVMTVAGWTVHRHNGFFIIREGWEYVFVLAVTGLVIAVLGPGGWSLDHAVGIADDLDGWAGLAIALGVGVGAGVAQLLVFFRPPARG